MHWLREFHEPLVDHYKRLVPCEGSQGSAVRRLGYRCRPVEGERHMGVCNATVVLRAFSPPWDVRSRNNIRGDCLSGLGADAAAAALCAGDIRADRDFPWRGPRLQDRMV